MFSYSFFFMEKIHLVMVKKKIHKNIKDDVGNLLIKTDMRWRSFYNIPQLIF